MASHPAQSVLPDDPVAQISSFLADELHSVERILHEIIESDSPLIREVGEYVCLATGKKLRPMMTLLTARALGRDAAPPVKIAAAMEAVHVATLLHDDVIDKGLVRRGQPSVNARWGDDVAILMADYLFASAFELATEHLNNEPLHLLCQVTRRMCEGELFQIERRGQWLSSDDYMHIITCKTAYLFSACAALGGIYGALPAEGVSQLANFGLEFGIAFQITDDTLDYVASDAHWGKAVGQDLANGKQTLPLILARRDASPEDRKRIDAVMNDGRDFQVISEILARYQSIDRARELACQHAREARTRLEAFTIHDETAYAHLLTLADYVVSRRY